MSDPNDPKVAPTMPPPPAAAPAAQAAPSDFFDKMRAALPLAHQVSLQQAYDAGQLAQEKIDEVSQNPSAAAVARALDEVVAKVQAVSGYFDLFPEPARTILKDAALGLKVADDVLAPFGF
jgi:hypothetical protein